MQITELMKARLAFHRAWPAVSRRLNKELPTRFTPMHMDDELNFGRIVFDLCHRHELFAQDEVHLASVLMTLFGHQFQTDPRFSPITDILFNTAQKARLRKVKPLIAPLVEQVWGATGKHESYLERATSELRALRRQEQLRGLFSPIQAPMPMFAQWHPAPLDQALYLANAQTILERMNVRGNRDIDVCFWAIWVLGLNFDTNPQFQWWIRTIDRAGNDSQLRYERLLKWLERLASGMAMPENKET